MPKKSIIAILCATVLCMVSGIALVFTVGSRASAANNPNIGTLYLKEHFIYYDSAKTRLNGLSATGEQIAKNCTELHINIPEGVTIIYDGAGDLMGCSPFGNYTDKFTVVTFPSTLEAIDDWAFYACSALTQIDLSNTRCDLIGIGAFYGCRNLQTIELSAGLTFVADDSDTAPFDNRYLPILIAPNATVANNYKTGVLKDYANQVTYAAGLQINLTGQDNEPSVYLEKQLVGSGFNNWHYVNGQWVQGSHAVAALPTLPDGWVWQFGDAELTADKVQELYNAAVSAGRLDTINATAVKIATEPENPDTGDGENNGEDNNGGEDGGENNGDEGGEDTDPDDPNRGGDDNNGGSTEPDDPDNGNNTDPSDPNNPDNGDGNGSDQPTDPTSPDDSDSGGDDNITDATENNDSQSMEWWEQATYIGLGVAGLLLVAVFVYCMTKIAILEHAYRKLVKQAMKK